MTDGKFCGIIFIQVKIMGLCLAVTSGKGGTGKSTVSCGLALALAKKGKKVLLIDLDIGLRCLDLFFGIDDKIVFDLSDIEDDGDISNIVYKASEHYDIFLIPAPDKPAKIDNERLSRLIENAKEIYDAVILDFPAGTDFSLCEYLKKDTQFLAVCNPDPVSVRDASAICTVLADYGFTARLIINRFNISLIKNKTYQNIDSIIDYSGFRLLGIVPDDRELMLLPITHNLKKNGRAFKALARISGRLCGEDIRLMKPKKI